MKNYLLISALLCVSMSAIAWEIISGPPLQPSQVMKERLGSDRRYAILYNILENPYVNPETPKIEPYEKPSYVTRVDLNTGEHEAIVFDLPLGDVYDLIEALWDPFNNQTYLTIKARISDFYDWCIITLDEKNNEIKHGRYCCSPFEGRSLSSSIEIPLQSRLYFLVSKNSTPPAPLGITTRK